MDIHRHPELLDRLAAAYAIGTLRGGARRRFETLARERAPVRAAALVWQSRVASMTELAPAVTPSPVVWTRIHNLIEAEREQAAMAAARAEPAPPPPTGWWRSLALWRGAAGAGALATVLAVVTTVGLRDRMGAQIDELQAKLSAQPQIEYVAVLNDEQASASMLVTFDPKNRKLTLQRVGGHRGGGVARHIGCHGALKIRANGAARQTGCGKAGHKANGCKSACAAVLTVGHKNLFFIPSFSHSNPRPSPASSWVTPSRMW